VGQQDLIGLLGHFSCFFVSVCVFNDPLSAGWTKKRRMVSDRMLLNRCSAYDHLWNLVFGVTLKVKLSGKFNFGSYHVNVTRTVHEARNELHQFYKCRRMQTSVSSKTFMWRIFNEIIKLTPWSRVLLEKLTVSQSNSTPSMEREVSLFCSQRLTTGPYPESDTCSPHPPNLFLLRSILILPYNLRSALPSGLFLSFWTKFFFYKFIASL
jgi:hypothetical protein